MTEKSTLAEAAREAQAQTGTRARPKPAEVRSRAAQGKGDQVDRHVVWAAALALAQGRQSPA